MILQTEKLPDWSSDQAATLKEFLQSETGQAAIAHVLSERPSLLDGADVNRTLVASGEVKGFTTAIESLFRLTYEQPAPEVISNEYPDLDDEAQWTKTPTNEPTNQNG